MSPHPLRYQVLSQHSAEGTLRYSQGCSMLFCHGCAEDTPHTCSPSLPLRLPALCPWHKALCIISAEVGTAKSTNTFLPLILYPVPTLQLKSRGAKQNLHTTHKWAFLSYPFFLPTQHIGHPQDSDPVHLTGHVSCQQKTAAVQNEASYLLFSSLRQKSKAFQFEKWL